MSQLRRYSVLTLVHIFGHNFCRVLFWVKMHAASGSNIIQLISQAVFSSLIKDLIVEVCDSVGRLDVKLLAD